MGLAPRHPKAGHAQRHCTWQWWLPCLPGSPSGLGPLCASRGVPGVQNTHWTSLVRGNHSTVTRDISAQYLPKLKIAKSQLPPQGSFAWAASELTNLQQSQGLAKAAWPTGAPAPSSCDPHLEEIRGLPPSCPAPSLCPHTVPTPWLGWRACKGAVHCSTSCYLNSP